MSEASTMRASVRGSDSTMARAESAGRAMQAVARASARAQSGATTVADRVDVDTGRPVTGDIVWPTVPEDVVR